MYSQFKIEPSALQWSIAFAKVHRPAATNRRWRCYSLIRGQGHERINRAFSPKPGVAHTSSSVLNKESATAFTNCCMRPAYYSTLIFYLSCGAYPGTCTGAHISSWWMLQKVGFPIATILPLYIQQTCTTSLTAHLYGTGETCDSILNLN